MLLRHAASEADTRSAHVWTDNLRSVFVDTEDGASDEYCLEDLSVQELMDVVRNADGMCATNAEAYLTFVRATGRVPCLDTWADMPVFVDPSSDELAQMWFDDLLGELLTDAEWERVAAYLDCEALVAEEFKTAVQARGPSGRAFWYLPDWTVWD